jgi:hypothetical protein
VTTAKKTKSRTTPLPLAGRVGFTIVELLVAAVILLIAVVAVVAMIRKSAEMQVDDYHRRQARAIAMRLFENEFAYNLFAMEYSIPVGPGETPRQTISLSRPDGRAILGTYQTAKISGIVIDTRSYGGAGAGARGGAPLMCEVFVRVRHDTLNLGDPFVTMAVNTATIRVEWDEPWGRDSIVMSRQMLTEGI